jgi:hypothetical protein
MTAGDLELTCNAFGKLVLSVAGQTWHGVVPVRAFPIASPDNGIGLINGEGHEVFWIEELTAVPEPAQGLIRQALAAREFMPEIQSIESVTSYSTPCAWLVKTDRGDTEFILRGDEDIRRLTPNTLLITDSHGIAFLIRDLSALNRESRKIMDRFL